VPANRVPTARPPNSMGNTFRDIVRPPLVGYEMQSLATPVAAVTPARAGCCQSAPGLCIFGGYRKIKEPFRFIRYWHTRRGTQMFAANMTHRQWVGLNGFKGPKPVNRPSAPIIEALGRTRPILPTRNREGLNRHRLVPPSMVKLAFL
jgi:hypothetical protein